MHTSCEKLIIVPAEESMPSAKIYRLSIVVPVYGVEPWIERCVRSIVEDPAFGGSCELIIVDDGSPDRSIEIAERASTGHHGVRFIRQANQGLGAARNVGAAAAQGEYIWFVDSDDWLCDGGLTRVLTALHIHPSLEVLNVDYIMSDGQRSTVINNALPDRVYSGVDYLACSFVQNPVQYYVWSTNFYRTHALSFEPGVYHEDALFTPIALYRAKRVLRFAHDCYIYNLREGSIMSSGKHLKHALDMVHVVQELERFRLNQARDYRGARVLATYSALAVGGIFYYWKRLDAHGKVEVARQLHALTLLRPVLRAGRLKYLLAIIAMQLAGVLHAAAPT